MARTNRMNTYINTNFFFFVDAKWMQNTCYPDVYIGKKINKKKL